MLTNKGVALENSRHFATPSKVSSRNCVTLRGNVGNFEKYQLFKSGRNSLVCIANKMKPVRQEFRMVAFIFLYSAN